MSGRKDYRLRPLEQSVSHSLCACGWSGPARSAALQPKRVVEAANNAMMATDFATLMMLFMGLVWLVRRNRHRYTMDVRMHGTLARWEHGMDLPCNSAGWRGLQVVLVEWL